MKLIGRHKTGPWCEAASLIGELWDALPRQVRAEEATRYVGYEFGNGEECVSFFGIEAAEFAANPRGTAVHEFTDSTWTIREGQGGETVLWRGPVRWLWQEPSAFGGRVMGEFTAAGPAEWGLGGAATARLCASAPVTAARQWQDEVQLAEYDPRWPAEFQAFAAELRSVIGEDVALRIEHLGSTAVPGMPAKPILDVLVEVPSWEQAKPRLLPCLAGQTWEYWWYEGKMQFVRRQELMGPRTHHVHAAPADHPVWRGLAFRDYLRSHADAAAEYAALKRRLAQAHRQDRERYTREKTAFVSEILNKAKDEKEKA